MYRVVKANNMTVKELMELLKTVPQDYIVSAAGITENMFINIDAENKYIIFDEYDLNEYN